VDVGVCVWRQGRDRDREKEREILDMTARKGLSGEETFK